MRLDSKYYSYCKEIGLMKENFSKQGALDSIKKEVCSTAAADPAFAALVQKLTLNSPEVSTRVCVLYSYSADVDYVVGGNIKSGTVSNFGYAGVPDSLHITDYKGNGEYTVLQDVSSIPYTMYNDENLFTYEQIKSALTKAIDDQLPKSTTSFKSRDWHVSAYFVPVLNVLIKYGGKTYYMNFNLQNGCYHWDYPDNPALIKKGMKARFLSFWAKTGGLLLAIIGALSGITAASGSNKIGLLAILPVIINFIIVKKTKKSKAYCKKLFIKNPNMTMVTALKSGLTVLILGVVSFLVGVIANGG